MYDLIHMNTETKQKIHKTSSSQENQKMQQQKREKKIPKIEQDGQLINEEIRRDEKWQALGHHQQSWKVG